MSTRKPLFISLCVASVISSTAWADDDVLSATSLGMGSTAVADGDVNDGITVNPGLLGLKARYDITAIGGLGYRGWVAGGNVVDSRQKFIAMGIGYQRAVYEPPLTDDDIPGWYAEGTTPSNFKRYHDIHLGAAVPVLDRKLSFGINGAVSITEHDRQGQDILGNLDFGMGARPTPWLTIGVVGRNLIPIKDQPEFPMAVMAGVRADDEAIGAVALDVNVNVQNFEVPPVSVRFGLEKTIASVADLRLGYHWEGPQDAHRLSAGLGAHNDKGSVDFGFDMPLQNIELKALVLRLGIHIKT